MTHRFDLRVYYEDTDLAGIVYYANYLKFIERARTEFVRALGVDQTALKVGQGIVFAVRRVEAEYLLPAVFEDDLTVETRVQRGDGRADGTGAGCAAGRCSAIPLDRDAGGADRQRQTGTASGGDSPTVAA